jgi:hypothetical protein
MAGDMISVARAAAQAALGDEAPKKKNGLSPWRGLAIGAALVTVGRMAAGPGGRFVRELVQEHSSDGSQDDGPKLEQDDGPELEQDKEPELEQDEEPELEQDEAPELDAEAEEPDAEADEPNPEADDEPEADEPDAEADEPDAQADDEPDAQADDEPRAEREQDEQTKAQGERGRSGRPHHPLFERALAREGVQRRSEQAPKSQRSRGRRRIAPPRRPRRPRAPARRG